MYSLQLFTSSPYPILVHSYALTPSSCPYTQQLFRSPCHFLTVQSRHSVFVFLQAYCLLLFLTMPPSYPTFILILLFSLSIYLSIYLSIFVFKFLRFILSFSFFLSSFTFPLSSCLSRRCLWSCVRDNNRLKLVHWDWMRYMIWMTLLHITPSDVQKRQEFDDFKNWQNRRFCSKFFIWQIV